MEDQIKQIAARLKGLREVLNLTEQDVADICQISVEHYREVECGTCDLSVSRLQMLARHTGIPLDVLMFGEEPRMNTYFITRNAKGAAVERRAAYRYESKAAGFAGRKMDPFVVTVEPTAKLPPLSSHVGQEFIVVAVGRLEITLGDNLLELGYGDSIYFNSETPHRMRALDNQRAIFLMVSI